MEFNVNKSVVGQKAYVEKTGSPFFAPESGFCWSCEQNIYEEVEKQTGNRTYTTGIDVDTASKSLVINCPHCHRSYCD